MADEDYVFGEAPGKWRPASGERPATPPDRQRAGNRLPARQHQGPGAAHGNRPQARL